MVKPKEPKESMNIGMDNQTSKKIAYYAVLSGIGLGAAGLILEIWGLWNDELRNRMIFALVVVVVTILAFAITNVLFASAEEESDSDEGDDYGRDIGNSLRRAKTESKN